MRPNYFLVCGDHYLWLTTALYRVIVYLRKLWLLLLLLLNDPLSPLTNYFLLSIYALRLCCYRCSSCNCNLRLNSSIGILWRSLLNCLWDLGDLITRLRFDIIWDLKSILWGTRIDRVACTQLWSIAYLPLSLWYFVQGCYQSISVSFLAGRMLETLIHIERFCGILGSRIEVSIDFGERPTLKFMLLVTWVCFTMKAICCRGKVVMGLWSRVTLRYHEILGSFLHHIKSH